MRDEETTSNGKQKIDQDLIEKILSGDREAFAELVEAYYRFFYGIAMGFCRNHEKAEDAVQEGLIDIYKELKHLREPEKFKYWAYTIIRRKCMKIFRENAKENRTLNTYSEEQVVQASVYKSQDTDKFQNQQLYNPSQILEQIHKLPTLYREVIVLHLIEKMDFEEIRKLLKIPIKTAQQRFFRAKHMLKVNLEKRKTDD